MRERHDGDQATDHKPEQAPEDRRREAVQVDQRLGDREAETGAYLLSGRARIYFGKDYQEYVEMSEGDFMFVPPFIHHLECNMSTTEELWWLACRTPENIVVNLPDIDDALLKGYRRA